MSIRGEAHRAHEPLCSSSEAGSYLRLIDCVYHSTPGLRVIKKKKKKKKKVSGSVDLDAVEDLLSGFRVRHSLR